MGPERFDEWGSLDSALHTRMAGLGSFDQRTSADLSDLTTAASTLGRKRPTRPDPASILGLSAGLISLGLQVFGGVREYVDAFQGRDEEVAGLLSQTQQLKDALVWI